MPLINKVGNAHGVKYRLQRETYIHHWATTGVFDYKIFTGCMLSAHLSKKPMAQGLMVKHLRLSHAITPSSYHILGKLNCQSISPTKNQSPKISYNAHLYRECHVYLVSCKGDFESSTNQTLNPYNFAYGIQIRCALVH